MIMIKISVLFVSNWIDSIFKVSYVINKLQIIMRQILTVIQFIWASSGENLSSGFVNNKGADQNLRSLISTFVICLLESMTVSYLYLLQAIFQLLSQLSRLIGPVKQK